MLVNQDCKFSVRSYLGSLATIPQTALQMISQKVQSIWNTAVDTITSNYRMVQFGIDGMKTRKTIGYEYTAIFPENTEISELSQCVEEFMNYRVNSETYYDKIPLPEKTKNKLVELTYNQGVESEAAKRLLAKCNNPKFTRKHFDGDDYRALDKATFELLKEFTPKIHYLIHSKHLNHIVNGVMDHFNFNYFEAVIAEILARTLAYNPSLDGEEISLPFEMGDGFCEMATFKIKAFYLGDELPAYVLESQDEEGNDLHPPWFIIRGTDANNPKTTKGERLKKGCIESILADFHREGIAEGIVDHSIVIGGSLKNGKKIDLFELFENRFFKLTGHSLGGNIVNQMSMRLHHFIKQAYAFSAPGVSELVAQQWEQKKIDNSKLINFQTEGDAIPTAGNRLIGTHIAIAHIKKIENANSEQMHVSMCLTKPFKIKYIDKKAEEQKISRRFIENARYFLGPIFEKIAEVIIKHPQPSWKWSKKVSAIKK